MLKRRLTEMSLFSAIQDGFKYGSLDANGKDTSGRKGILPIFMYQDWFDALRDGDRDYVTYLLDDCDPEQKDRLLNGVFRFDHEADIHKVFHALDLKDYTATRPLILSVLHGSAEVCIILGLKRTGISYIVILKFSIS